MVESGKRYAAALQKAQVAIGNQHRAALMMMKGHRKDLDTGALASNRLFEIKPAPELAGPGSVRVAVLGAVLRAGWRQVWGQAECSCQLILVCGRADTYAPCFVPCNCCRLDSRL